MRIIGGEFGGRRFKFQVPSNTRPTSDRVKESMFNVLENLIDFEDLFVLDLFAGTGALGLESMSRGAENVTFVDKDRKSFEIIKFVTNELRINKNSFEFYSTDVIKFLKNYKSNIKFDLVFADPPYDKFDYNLLIDTISESAILNAQGIFVVEYRNGMVIQQSQALELLSQKEFGDTNYNIYKFL
ncbi:16S rRNA (guanine(966)-N(2))-methyltransferase RsmD [Candidatus Kapaibacterium sp.]